MIRSHGPRKLRSYGDDMKQAINAFSHVVKYQIIICLPLAEIQFLNPIFPFSLFGDRERVNVWISYFFDSDLKRISRIKLIEINPSIKRGWSALNF